MALDDPRLKTFCNNKIRPLADDLVAITIKINDLVAEYDATNIGLIITNGGSDNIVQDGAANGQNPDGRPPITGGDIWNFITLLQAYQALINGSTVSIVAGRLTVLYKIQVNGLTRGTN